MQLNNGRAIATLDHVYAAGLSCDEAAVGTAPANHPVVLSTHRIGMGRRSRTHGLAAHDHLATESRGAATIHPAPALRLVRFSNRNGIWSPGCRISRSVLADRLRRLETLGLVARCESGIAQPCYRLTAIGEGLMVTLGSLRDWADTWLPDDPDMLERDPDVVLGWLARRADSSLAPARPVVLEIRLGHRLDRRYWLVLQGGVEPYGCLIDPLIDPSRYVYIDCSLPALFAFGRGRCDWADLFADGSATVAGDPELLEQVADWFGHRTRWVARRRRPASRREIAFHGPAGGRGDALLRLHTRR